MSLSVEDIEKFGREFGRDMAEQTTISIYQGIIEGFAAVNPDVTVTFGELAVFFRDQLKEIEKERSDRQYSP